MLRDFPVDTSLVPLNHASYGLPTADLLARAEQVRCELERDANTNLGEVLTHRLGEIAQQVHDWLGLPGGELALTRNTTEAAAAVCASLPCTPTTTSSCSTANTPQSSQAGPWPANAPVPA